MPKFHTNRTWLYNRYVRDGKTAKEIAAEAGVTEMTIDRYLDKFELKRNRRRNL